MMQQSMDCLLCSSRAEYFGIYRNKCYYRCTYCLSIMMGLRDFLSPKAEKHRYDQHNNDVYNPGYRKFVEPLVEKIKLEYRPEAEGLDFGAGPGPVATVILKEKGYRAIELYDPYYHPDQSVLKKQYDFIICCEVVEHFHQPLSSFKLLRSLLLPGGTLYCMTDLYHENIDFGNWHYKNDPTHVFFYHRRALQWIKDVCDFYDLQVEKRLICFKTLPAKP